MAIQETFTQTSGLYSANNREFTISSADSTGFDFLKTSDVKVYLTIGGTKTLKIETDDYTLDKATKKITFVPSHAVPPTDSVVTAQRVTAVSEAINTFQAGSAVTASALNDSLNHLRFNIQEYGTLTNSGSLSDTDKGHITVSNSGNTWTIDDGAVTSAKLDTNIDIAGTLDVTSNSVFDANVNIKGDNKTFTIEKADGTDKFTVASQTGNTTVAGTLGVTGATTLTGALAANAGITVDTDKFTVADTTGNTVIDGTLNAKVEVTIDTGIVPDVDEGAYIGTAPKPFSEAHIGEIRIADSTNDGEIDTVSGNLTLDSAGGTTTIDDNCDVTGKLNVTAGPLCLGDGSELTISSGSITVTTSFHQVDTESDSDPDNLDKIECASYTKGQLLVLRSSANARDVQVRDNQHPGESYNIRCGGGGTIDLADERDTITFIWDDQWLRVSSNFN